jgi:hypothetical protein
LFRWRYPVLDFRKPAIHVINPSFCDGIAQRLSIMFIPVLISPANNIFWCGHKTLLVLIYYLHINTLHPKQSTPVANPFLTLSGGVVEFGEQF